MNATANESRWLDLSPFFDAIRASIANPSDAFFEQKWATLPESFVILVTKLRRLTKVEDLQFLTCAADDDGAPTNQLLAITAQHVISSSRSDENGEPTVEMWSRKGLYQLSVEHMAPHALPVETPRSHSIPSTELVVELRYFSREPLSVPFDRNSSLCADQLEAILPSLKDDIGAISITLR